MRPGPVPLVYVAHPLGNGPTRALNILRAKLWKRTLVEIIESVAFVAPWITYAETLDEETWRDRGMRDNLSVLLACKGIVTVGGRTSPGMYTEWELATQINLKLIDLTDLPADPRAISSPAIRVDFPPLPSHRSVIENRFARAFP